MKAMLDNPRAILEGVRQASLISLYLTSLLKCSSTDVAENNFLFLKCYGICQNSRRYFWGLQPRVQELRTQPLRQAGFSLPFRLPMPLPLTNLPSPRQRNGLQKFKIKTIKIYSSHFLKICQDDTSPLRSEYRHIQINITCACGCKCQNRNQKNHPGKWSKLRILSERQSPREI